MTSNSVKSFALALITLATLGAVTGCDPFPNDKTLGDEGKIEFSYASQCFLDCSLDSAIAVGSTEVVTFDGRATGLSFSSSDGAVVSFRHKMDSCSCTRSSGNDAEGYGPVPPDGQCAEGFELQCNVYVEAEALSEGDAKLEVWDEAGSLVDRVTVHALVARSAMLRRYENEDWHAVSSVEGPAGSELPVGVVFLDESGKALLSSEGVSWASADPAIATVEPQSALLNWSRGSLAQVLLKNAGETSVTARIGDYQAALPVIVTQ